MQRAAAADGFFRCHERCGSMNECAADDPREGTRVGCCVLFLEQRPQMSRLPGREVGVLSGAIATLRLSPPKINVCARESQKFVRGGMAVLVLGLIH